MLIERQIQRPIEAATFWLLAAGTPQVDPVDRSILEFVGHSAGAGTTQIAAHIQRTPRATRDRLKRLVAAGLLALGSSPKDPRKVYRLVGKPEAR